MAFNPGCGTNISHWLSQSEKRGKQRIDWFIREDVSRIADMGFNHIRIPIDEVQMWKEDGSVDNESFDLLNSSIYWCEREELKAIVDLHILRTHYFNDRSVSTLYRSDEMERFTEAFGEVFQGRPGSGQRRFLPMRFLMNLLLG